VSVERASPKRRIAGAAALLLLVCIAVVTWLYMAYYGAGPAATNGDKTVVVLRTGSGVSEIAETLEQGGAIKSAAAFKIAARLTGAHRTLQAGEYQFPSGASLAEVLDAVRKGDVVRWFVTVPEGRSSVQVIDILNASPVLVGTAEVPAEGSLLPDTYEVTRGDTRASVVKRMQQARNKALAELWAKRAADLPISTPEQAVILASIVEKETGVASERARVAAVFVNRLRMGMRLDSDPTIVYGITKGRPLGRGLRVSEIQAVTPWNTYRVSGLPPTPIANPGREAIAATLNPAKTTDLYFVADGSGGHAFSQTYEQHLANVARWRQIEKAAPPVYAAPAAPAAAAPAQAR